VRESSDSDSSRYSSPLAAFPSHSTREAEAEAEAEAGRHAARGARGGWSGGGGAGGAAAAAAARASGGLRSILVAEGTPRHSGSGSHSGSSSKRSVSFRLTLASDASSSKPKRAAATSRSLGKMFPSPRVPAHDLGLGFDFEAEHAL
jgi:hypothetical protein